MKNHWTSLLFTSRDDFCSNQIKVTLKIYNASYFHCENKWTVMQKWHYLMLLICFCYYIMEGEYVTKADK